MTKCLSRTQANNLSECLQQLARAAVDDLQTLTIKALPLDEQVGALATSLLPTTTALKNVVVELSEELSEETLVAFFLGCGSGGVSIEELKLSGSGNDSQMALLLDLIVDTLYSLRRLTLHKTNICPEGWLSTLVEQVPSLESVHIHLAPNQPAGIESRLAEVLMAPRCHVEVQDTGLFGRLAALFKESNVAGGELTLYYRPSFTETDTILIDAPSFGLILESHKGGTDLLHIMENTLAFDILRIDEDLRDFEAIAKIIRRNLPSLHTIDLRGQHEKDRESLAGLCGLFEALLDNTVITSVLLHECYNRGPANQLALARLSHRESLEVLSFDGVYLGSLGDRADQAVDVFIEGLAQRRAMRLLNMRYALRDTVRDEEEVRRRRTLALGEAIKVSGLRTVNLSKCYLRCDDVLALLEGLRGAPLERLSLSGNEIGDEGAVALARAIQSQELNVTELVLSNCKVFDDGLMALLGAMEHNDRITLLDLQTETAYRADYRYPPFTKKAAQALSTTLPRLQALRSLKLEVVVADEDCRRDLQVALLENRSVEDGRWFSIHRKTPVFGTGFDALHVFRAGPARNKAVRLLQEGHVESWRVPQLLAQLGQRLFGVYRPDILFGVLRACPGQVLPSVYCRKRERRSSSSTE